MTIKLKTAENEAAFLKCGILGFAGSGKSFTATKMAIGLQKYIKSKKPIAYIDTETGSNFVLPLFKKEGIELLTAKSKAFIDLMDITREAEKTCDILIIDSITHFYVELVDAYQKKLKRARLRVQDWGPIKMEWRQFTELFLNSKLHILMLGRAAWEYDFKEDDDGVTEITKTGTKMKAETEMGYEPSLLIEMEKVRIGDGKIGQSFIHRAWVLKDRFDKINGKSFDNPGFEQFLPHVGLLNIGGSHVGTVTEGSSQDLFERPDSGSGIHKRREIALENIQNEIVKRIPGRSDKAQQDKIKFLEDLFGTGSWTAISDLHPDRLEDALKRIIETPKMEETNGKN